MNRFFAFSLSVAITFSGTLFSTTGVEAHTQSYGFLRATVHDDHVSGQLELAVRDLDLAYALDADGDGNVTWGELRKRESELAPLVLRRISIGPATAPCELVPGAVAIDSRGGENYAIFPFTGSCAVLGSQVRVGYDLMFGLDAQHRGLVDLGKGGIARSTVMTPETRVAVLDLESGNQLDVIRSFIAHGTHHIWSGYDHMLFLVTLLLPAVVMRAGKVWRPVESLGGAVWATTRVVTAFTLAHSITLSAAASGIVELPSRLVECVIAASVAVAAINNLFPVVSRRTWIAAFVFGLMHGFGFASVLTDLGLPPGGRLIALFAFNVGVELGQLAVVAGLLPALFLIRRSATYTRVALPAGSMVIVGIGFMWLLQRATGMDIIPG
jgi:HupE / UreJ protein